MGRWFMFLSLFWMVLMLVFANAGFCETTEWIPVNGFGPQISSDGRYVVFISYDNSLVPGDNNNDSDVFVYDRVTEQVEMVSVDSNGIQGNSRNGHIWISLSTDGRLVCFPSYSDNLVPNDTNNDWDIFVRDRLTGTTEMVSVDSTGNQAMGFNSYSNMSADGRYVVFLSNAENLVPGGLNGVLNIFLHDRLTKTTELISADGFGNPGNNAGAPGSISADGRYIAFSSSADNLVPGDTNGYGDVFVHDRVMGTTEIVSVDSFGNQGNAGSGNPEISSDGRYVAFYSVASNLVPGGTNQYGDVYIRDRVAGITEIISVDNNGNHGNAESLPFVINYMSADGHFISFTSSASNLVSFDRNGAKDIFVRDRLTGTTEMVSVDSKGKPGRKNSHSATISEDGRYVIFESESELVRGADYGGIFVRDREASLP